MQSTHSSSVDHIIHLHSLLNTSILLSVFSVHDVNNCVFFVLILCTFDYDVVTAVCQLFINGYVMLCYDIGWLFLSVNIL